MPWNISQFTLIPLQSDESLFKYGCCTLEFIHSRNCYNFHISTYPSFVGECHLYYYDLYISLYPRFVIYHLFDKGVNNSLLLGVILCIQNTLESCYNVGNNYGLNSPLRIRAVYHLTTSLISAYFDSSISFCLSFPLSRSIFQRCI